MSVVVGIDLGTTNSSIAILADERPRLVEIDGSLLMPSVVSLSDEGVIIVGQQARNQRHLYPERTITSVKRHMGEDTPLSLGESYSPEEISAMILTRLRAAAEAELGVPVRRAVITVPAYFSDAQRTATRTAGELAGFTVERVFNEPTAAALTLDAEDGTILVYDLGGGTFDVSVVRLRGDITEVLASHGDTHLGGDDFDALLMEHIKTRFEQQTKTKLGDDLRAMARLARAAEAARIELSEVDSVQITEPNLTQNNKGVPKHLDLTVTRATLEALIEPLLLRTMDSVSTAMRSAGVEAADIDEVLLVGGAALTPRVSALLTERLGRPPKMSVDPTRAVCLGAGQQAARVAGMEAGILVDVTPFAFGTSYLGELNGVPSNHCFQAVIPRNAALPCTRVEQFYTAFPGQTRVEVDVYQGESLDARENTLLGEFAVEDLDPEAFEIGLLFELTVDLNGILKVTVTEQRTGRQRRLTIENAFATPDSEQIQASRAKIMARMDVALLEDEEITEGEAAPSFAPPAEVAKADHDTWSTALALVERAAHLLPNLEPIDAEEVGDLLAELRHGLKGADLPNIRATSTTLADVLFYLD